MNSFKKEFVDASTCNRPGTLQFAQLTLDDYKWQQVQSRTRSYIKDVGLYLL